MTNDHTDNDSSRDGDDEHGDDEHSISFEDIGAAYAKAAVENDPEAFVVADEADDAVDDSDEVDVSGAADFDDEELQPSPESIIEAALFVGAPDNRPLSPPRLASLMRDVTPEEVCDLVDQLNASYRQHGQAFRITQDEAGYRMTVAPEVESIRASFLGKIREARLSQLAVEVLALVAYQPGVTAGTVTEQRGRECGSVLNQLVRRRLLEMQRIRPEEGGRAVPHYYPTERFLTLFGLDSLADLPQVEPGNWTAE